MTTAHNLQPQAINYSRAPEITAAPGDVVAMTIEQAAAELDLPPSTLQFWISRKGCPVARRGRRGRGGATMVDPAAVRRWMASRDQPTAPTTERDLALAYAARLPDLLAEAMYRAWCEVDSPAKPALAVQVARAWYLATSGELDRLRDLWPDVPHVTTVPDAINKLKLIV